MIRDFDGNVKWINCWRIAWILLLTAAFFGAILQWTQAAKFLGAIGGVTFIAMFVIRFEDVKEFMDDGKGKR